MSEEDKPRRWWQTLPGVVTSLTALITAVAGLLVAVKQTGWLDSKGSPAAPGPTATSTQALPTPEAQAPPHASASPHAIALPAQRDYTLGHATFTLLKAEVSPRTAENSELHLRLRMTNHDRYDQNFWDRSFRLLVGGVPLAPEGGLDDLVPAQAAKEGDVLFVIPRDTASGSLRITYNDDSTEIPLGLASAK